MTWRYFFKSVFYTCVGIGLGFFVLLVVGNLAMRFGLLRDLANALS